MVVMCPHKYTLFISGDKNIFTLEFESMDSEVEEEDKGSRGHPGPKTHRLATEKLCQVIKALS